MTESDSGYAAVDKGTPRAPADEETQRAREDVRPEDDDTPVVGVEAEAEPRADLLPGQRAPRLAGSRAEEQDAEMADEADIPRE